MITLYSFGPYFGLPEPSPFTMKTQVQLKMAGLAFASEYGGIDRSPKHKLPFIDDDGTVVADSTFIRDYVEKTYAVDLDRHLSPPQRAQAWAIERMLEDHLYWAVVHARWTDDENFAKGPARFFDAAPEAMRGAIRDQGRQNVTTTLHGQGFGRHDRDELAALARRSFDALSICWTTSLTCSETVPAASTQLRSAWSQVRSVRCSSRRCARRPRPMRT